MSVKKYQPGDIVDLDDVVPTQAALSAWGAVAEQAAALCVALGIAKENLPEERARLNADGSLTLWIEVPMPGEGEVSLDMSVPPREWSWRQ